MTSAPGWAVAVAVGAVTLAAAPAARAANLSPEVDVGDQIPWTAPASERSVAFDGCEMVVLAKQGRYLGYDGLGDAAEHVYASRVALDGTVRDPKGVSLDLGSAVGVENGGEIVTVENAPGLFSTPLGAEPSFVRLGGDLTLLGRTVLDEPWLEQPTLACDNGGCLLSGWSGVQSFSERLVDFTGKTRADGVVSVTNQGWLSGPLVTPSTTGYLVAFTDQVKDGEQGVYTADVPANAKNPITPRLVTQFSGNPLRVLALTRSDSAFLLVAEEQPAPAQATLSRLIAARTDGSAPVVLSSDFHDYEVDAFGVGDHFVVGFRQSASATTPPGPATVAQIGASGITGKQPATRAFGPSVSTPRGRFVLDESLDLHRILDDGTEGSAPIHSMSTLYPEWRPSLVPGTENLLLTYQDRDATTHRWHAVRVGPDGVPFDTTAAPVFTRPVDPTSSALSSPAKLEAAFDGTAFVLGWIDDTGNLELVHENPDSGARDTPVTLGQVGADFQLHSGPHGILVTWSEGRMCGEDCGESRLLGVPLDATLHAAIAVPAVLVDWTMSGIGEIGPADFDGQRWLVPRAAFTDLYLSTVTEAGLVTTADPWSEPTASFSSDTFLTHPRIAWSGAEHLVVFERDTTNPTTLLATSEIRALRLDGNLMPLDAAPGVVAPASPSATPEVVFDGARFALAWRQGWPEETDLAATFVALDGTTQSSDCFLASNALFSGRGTTLAAVPPTTVSAEGEVLIGYSRLDPDPVLVASRVKLRLIAAAGSNPAPGCVAPSVPTLPDAPFTPTGCADTADSKVTGGCACSFGATRNVPARTLSAEMLVAVLFIRRRQRRRLRG